MRKFEDLKVFIVDDDPFCRMMYHQHLLNLGFKENSLFSSGPECISKLSEKPDIIFIDYDMKPFDGLETLQLIRQYDPNIYLLMLSAQKDIRVAINALKYGAFDYISKGKDDLNMITKAVNNIAVSRTKELYEVLV
ncbi:MAG: histidine kinase [Flavipsychrobacter sp.]|nr:histidine kinase [Flavipsychrobacter sp.]